MASLPMVASGGGGEVHHTSLSAQTISGTGSTTFTIGSDPNIIIVCAKINAKWSNNYTYIFFADVYNAISGDGSLHWTTQGNTFTITCTYSGGNVTITPQDVVYVSA